MPTRTCQPGDLLLLPLPRGGFAAALVARRDPFLRKGLSTVLCYGFAPRYDAVPSPEEVAEPRLGDAIAATFCVESAITSGRWRPLRSLVSFDPAQWPVPPCPRTDMAAQSNRPDPRELIIVTEEETLSDEICLPRGPYLSEEEFWALPNIWGLASPQYFEEVFEGAILDPSKRLRITPERAAAWRECVGRVKAAGLYPAPRQPTPAATRPKTRARPPAEAAFWPTIEAARRAAGADAAGEDFVEALSDRLAAAAPEQIQSFARDLSKHLYLANTWDLWAAASLMNGGCSDDGFLYFRCWLIAQGQRVFERAVEEPDSLALARLRYGEEGEYELEDLLEAPADAYEQAAGSDLPEPGVPASAGKPRGRRFREQDEADLKRRLPRLWKKYGAG